MGRMRISRAVAAGKLELIDGKVDPKIADAAFGVTAAAPPAELVSMREYARRRGISHVAVSKAVKAGRVPLVNGKIDPELADQAFEANTDPSKPGRKVTGRPGQRTSEPQLLPLEPRGGNGDGKGASYADARAERERTQARLAQLQLERQEGALVEADVVRNQAFREARRARDLLLALPGRLAPLLATVDDEREIETILEEEIEQLCAEISEARAAAGADQEDAEA